MADSSADVAEVEPANPYAGRSHSDLLAEYARLEAVAGVFTTASGQVRTELERRAFLEVDTQGVRPAWTATKLARLVTKVPDPYKVGVVDQAALNSWLAQHFPSEVTATILLGAADLPRALEVLEAAGLRVMRADVEARETFVKTTLLNACDLVEVAKTTEDDQPIVDAQGNPVIERLAIYSKTGQTVDGLGAVAGAPRGIAITVEKQAKEQAQAEVGPVAVALAQRLGASPALLGIAAPTPTRAEAAIASALAEPFDEPEAAGDPEPEDAGEPHEPVCRCGALESLHGGAKMRGGYKPTKCRRFQEQEQAA